IYPDSLIVSAGASAVSGDGTNVCTTVPGTSGTPVYRVAVGLTYDYQASGCITIQQGAGAHSADPDGNMYLNTCTTFTGGSAMADNSFVCSGFISYSLVGEIEGTCVQLGSSGSFVAPASG